MRWQVEHLDQVDSTNTALLRLVNSTLNAGGDLAALSGRVLLADRQTAGRGQHGRTWLSPPGGLYFSAVLGDLSAPLRPLTPLLVGTAIAQAIEVDGITGVALRWPNDVVIAGKKVAGVLCEAVAVGATWIGVAGIGVNVNTPLSALAAELGGRATTLLAQDGTSRDLAALLQNILNHLAAFMAATPDRVVEAVRRRDSLLGHQVTLQQDQGLITGVAAGIDDQGALLLTTASGTCAVPFGPIMAIDGLPIR